ncbi:TPA: hypothetical protein DF272_03480 [Candidatus Falkowbacteria bacterium]|nr:hypothetical protein [Candidatus Falkowbacteria bacterium]
MSLIRIREDDHVDVAEIRPLSTKEVNDVKMFDFFEPTYLETRTANIKNGKVTAVVPGLVRKWYFVAHDHGTGVYRRDELTLC